jgi:serine/threonine-protein kinase
MPFDFPPANSVNSSVSRRTSEALQKALQKVPQDRFATMNDFWEALRPERARKQGQVRVAQPTVQLPQAAAAQVSGVPAMAGAAAQPQPAAPAQRPAPPPAARPAPQRPAPPTPSPQQPARRRRGLMASIAALMSWALALLIVAAIGLGAYVFVARPAWADPFIAPITNLTPTSSPTVLTSRQVEIDVTIQVADGSSSQQIASALQAAFAAAAKAQNGEGTLVNPNVPPSAVGNPVRVGGPDANGQVTYQARMQGYIYTP